MSYLGTELCWMLSPPPPPPTDNFQSLTAKQRRERAVQLLQKRFGDQFDIKAGNIVTDCFSQFTGGGGHFYLKKELWRIVLHVPDDGSDFNSSKLESRDDYEEGELRCGVMKTS